MLATCRSIIKLVDPDELPLYAVSLVLGSYAYSVIGIAAMLIYAGLVLIGVV
jgi:hypothetical protein